MRTLGQHIASLFLTLCAFCFFCPLYPHAQSQTLNFNHLLLGKGQDINVVFDILQDRQGFMWFATLDGLVRYDGYHFKYYRYDREGNSQLKAQRADALLEDASGNIWILASGWLQVLNPKLEKFYTFTNLGGESLLPYSGPKYKEILLQDTSGNIWLSSWRGLFRIREGQGDSPYEVKHYRHEEQNPLSLSSDTIHALLYDSRHRLWIGTQNGLNFYDQERDTFVRYNQGCTAPVSSLCETSSGKICVGTRDAGLCFFDPDTKNTTQYLPQPNDAFSIAGLSVQQITCDGKGNIWLFSGPVDKKMFSLQRFDPVSGQFIAYFSPIEPQGFNRHSALHLYVDRTGFLWVVTGVGLKRFDPYREAFSDIQQRETYLKDWHLPYVFYEDQSGVLWIGTRTKGILKYAASTQKFRVYSPPQSEGKNIAGSMIRPIYEDSRGYLWVGTADGINRYAFDENDELQKIAHFSIYAFALLESRQGQLWISSTEGLKLLDLEGKMLSTTHLAAMNRPMSAVVLEDKEGRFWAPSWGSGLLRLDPKDGKIIAFLHDPEDTCSINSDYLTGSMLEDKQGNIWANGVNGLKKYDPETGDFHNYLLGIETLQVIEGRPGRFWATTAGYGLFQLDEESGETKRYSRQEGFPTIRPTFLLKDKQGDLWMSSDVGIIHFEPDREAFHLYDEADGLPSPVFAYGSCQRKNGEFFFPLWEGGFIRFHPDSLRIDSIPPKPAIVDFRLFNQAVEIGGEGSPLSQSTWATERIILKYDQNVFTLRFTAFHYAAPEHNRLLYKMEGIDTNWADPGGQRTVNYAGLRPGDYRFHLKAANHDGIWSEPVTFNIAILPPWWKTAWAYLLYAAVIISSLYFLYRFQLKRQLERAENRRLKEFDAFKNQFYANITHEFRTPLTVIIGMARQMSDDPGKWFREGVNMIVRNGQNLLRLVNQMLDLSKLESGSMPVNLIQGDIIAYLRYVMESFHSLAENKNIRLCFLTDLEALRMDYDPEKVLAIVSNLLSNAIKFTPEGGDVQLIVDCYQPSVAGRPKQPPNNQKPATGSYLLLTVTDTGIGIPPEKLPFIFDRFYQVNDVAIRNAEGTGIGLALTRELVKLLQGEISVQSPAPKARRKGTEFLVKLPVTVTNQVPLEEEMETIKIRKSLPPFANIATGKEAVTEEGAMPAEERPVLLIIEDNADVVLYLESFLAKDYRIEVAKDGQKGIQTAIEFVPDIIVSDVMMPVKDGFEVCNTLKKDERTSHIPIILLTAKADMPSRIEGLERGADAYLVKPFHKEELLVRLHKLVELRKQLQARYASFEPLPISENKGIQIEDAFMQKVRNILEEHLSDESFGIPGLCQALGMSRAQLYRKFKALTDQPVGHYFRSLRLNKAKALLLTTDLQISEIAYEVGFKEPSYFTRAFKEAFGVTPSEARAE
ncbi:MAG: helix-turn-helix domain-containing protein [Phaeodactylibacter sp.]|nr:helix-turn-helix domain-containing protein [Phaeodactylibacter sp.]